MNWLDAVLLFILALSVIAGFRKGLSRQIVGLVSVVAAIVIGLWTYGLAGNWLTELFHIDSRRVANFAGFALVFCGVLLLGSLVGFLIHKFLKVTGLSFFDRVLGAGFALVFCGVLLLGSLVGFLIHKFLKVTGLSFFDRVLGAGFGVVRGTLIAVALILGMLAFSAEGKPPESVVHSRMAPYAVGAARVFAAMAPYEMREGFRRSYGQVKSTWQKTIEKQLRKNPDGREEKDEKRI